MPTGYTADVADGKVTDFPTFAMRCARGMDACISMRDAAHDAEIPEAFTPSDYNEKQIVATNAKLAELDATPESEYQAMLDEQYNESLEAYRVALVEMSAERTRYDEMIADVKAWNPPTTEHVGLKTFMLQQLTSSREFDSYEPTKPAGKLTVGVWLAGKKSELLKNIEYHEEHHADEVKRCQERTEWVQQLRSSLSA